MPRSGTTLLFEVFAAHDDLAWLSQPVARAPRLPMLAALSRLTQVTPRMRRAVRGSDQLRPSLERLRIGPVEAYGFWEDCCGEKFRSDYLLGLEATPDERQCVRSRVSRVTRYHGKPRFAAKITGPGRIAYLTSIFPDARFIHVIRDGRAVVSSLLRVGFWRELNWMNEPAWRNGLTAGDLEDWNRYDRSPLALAAVQWRRVVETTRAEGERVAGDRYGEIHYERFLGTPRSVLEVVASFCELAPSASAERFLASRFELRDMNVQWRARFDLDEVEILNELIGPTLLSASYSLDARRDPNALPVLRRPFSMVSEFGTGQAT
jgi:omega-hydroxy-beta-dihydromenaquinone-9 sulfotransferase